MAATFRANVLQSGAKRRDDRRHRPQQRNQPRSRNRPRAHRPDVAAPDLVRRHQRNGDRRGVDRRVPGELPVKLDRRHHHQPRHNFPREQNSRHPRPNDVAHAEIFRSDGHAKRCAGIPAWPRLRLPRPRLHRVHQERVNPAQTQSPENPSSKRPAALSRYQHVAHAVPSGKARLPCSFTISCRRMGTMKRTPSQPPRSAMGKIRQNVKSELKPRKISAGKVNITPAASDSPADPVVCTMLFSRMVERPKARRMLIDNTEIGIDADTVSPARNPTYTVTAPNSSPNNPPSNTARNENSAKLSSAVT